MKSVSSRDYLGLRERSLPVLCATILLSGGMVGQATDALSSWNQSVTVPPNIDATNFYNSGNWNIYVTPKPFMTASTFNYTNVGFMNSTIGWEFDWGPPNSGNSGPRSWSSTFYNDTLGEIYAGGGVGSYLQAIPVGYLWVSATNIVNKGFLSADAYSEIKLTGSSVDVHRSSIEIVPLTGSGSGNNLVDGNFTPDNGIFDLYWGQSGVSNVVSSSIWNGSNAATSLFRVAEPCGVTNVTQFFSVTANYSDSTNMSANFYTVTVTNYPNYPASSTPVVTNITVASNEVRQAVFIYTSDSNVVGQVRFSPSSIPTNNFDTVAVQLTSPYLDFATFTTQTNYLYLVDTLASSTNRGVLPSLFSNPYAACSDTTYRPANYVLSRVDTGAFAAGVPGAGQPTNNFLYERAFTNNLVGMEYGAYSALVDNQAYPMPYASITNLPGRVQIKANNLNLSQARIRAEGSVNISSSNLLTSTGAYVDCQNLSYDLGATNGHLNFTNLVNASVTRLSGTVSCWSAVWQNSKDLIVTNYTLDTNGLTAALITNRITENLYALIVDAGGLSTHSAVTVQNLALHSTNIVVGDSMSVANSLLFDGQSLTLNGGLNLLSSSFITGTNLAYYFGPYFYNVYTAPIENWTYAIAPKLLYFTNNNALYIPSAAHFGDDGPTNYLTFVNNGSISSSGQTIDAQNVQINGFNLTSAGNFSCLCETGMLNGASIFSSRDVNFTANVLQLDQAFISAQNALNFNVSGSLSDGGPASFNSLYCQNGFNLWTKPATGDLLGTAISTVAYYGAAEVDHYWAGVNYGNSTAGYANNVAIGTLLLVPDGSTNAFFEPLFRFFGTAGTVDGNGLYVSNLDLSMLTDYANEIEIDPSLDIYYMSASLNGTNGAEQFLDGQFNNHLHWVQGLVGAARPKIASNTRFQLTVNYTLPNGFQIGNVVMPAQTNVIEASSDLKHWFPIYTNIGSYTNIGPTTIFDPHAKDFSSRFYRAVPGP